MNLAGHSQPARGRWQVPARCLGSGGSRRFAWAAMHAYAAPVNFESSKAAGKVVVDLSCVCRECALVSLFPGATKSALKENAGKR
jgi:hypothetical protein